MAYRVLHRHLYILGCHDSGSDDVVVALQGGRIEGVKAPNVVPLLLGLLLQGVHQVAHLCGAVFLQAKQYSNEEIILPKLKKIH